MNSTETSSTRTVAADCNPTSRSSNSTAVLPPDPSQLTGELPPLPYTLHTRKLSILFFWTMMLIDSCLMPIALYVGLWYGTSLSHNHVFTISTALFGGVAIWEYTLRTWHLALGKTSLWNRPLGNDKKWGFDAFHWCFTGIWVVLATELIVGTIPREPIIRLLAMPPASVMFFMGFAMLYNDFLYARHHAAPFRISSVPKGKPIRPSVYTIVEDIVAVDGAGGRTFRSAWNERYLASPILTDLLWRLGVFWAIGAIVVATAITGVVMGIRSRLVGYIVAWVVPWIWVAVWTGVTVGWVRAGLRREREVWEEQMEKQ